MTSRPRCGAPCTSTVGRCRREVAREGLRCPWHRGDLPVLEEADAERGESP